ncbi:MAG: dihydroorotase [bacterium]
MSAATPSDDFLFTNGFLCDPASGIAGRRDLLVRDGRVQAVGHSLEPFSRWKRPASRLWIYDLDGLCLLPGLVDIHTHLRVPGQEHKETLLTGTQAAAAGGFTTILAMPNTRPCVDRVRVLRSLQGRIRREAVVRVLPVAAVTRGERGKRLAPIEELRAQGAVAFSDDGAPVADARLMREALKAVLPLGCPVISHCEDPALFSGGVVQEGPVAERLGLPGIPGAAEEVMVARDLCLAAETGARLHLAHLSTARSLCMVRLAKERGVAVTAEVTPHHFSLTEEAVFASGANAKMNPPLRPERDRQALIEGLRDGTVDAVASDHAPHHPEEKAQPLDRAPYGVIGLETTVPLVFSLVHLGTLPLERAVELLTIGPARVMGLAAGVLGEGRPADLVAVDREREYRVDVRSFRSKARNCPFDGRPVRGKVVLTMVGGRVVFEEGEAFSGPKRQLCG